MSRTPKANRYMRDVVASPRLQSGPIFMTSSSSITPVDIYNNVLPFLLLWEFRRLSVAHRSISYSFENLCCKIHYEEFVQNVYLNRNGNLAPRYPMYTGTRIHCRYMKPLFSILPVPFPVPVPVPAHAVCLSHN